MSRVSTDGWKIYRLISTNQEPFGVDGDWINYYATSNGYRYYLGFNLVENQFRDGTDERRLDLDPNGTNIKSFIRCDIARVRRRRANQVEEPF